MKMVTTWLKRHHTLMLSTPLLRARIKYVAGGQDMDVKKVGNDGLLTSVRYGKGANNRTDWGTSETRTQRYGCHHDQQLDLSAWVAMKL